MAKVGNLEIGTEKIALHAATEFFSPTVDVNGTYWITIDNATVGPNLIYAGGKSGGSMSLYKSRGGVGTLVGVLVGNTTRGVLIDNDHLDTETYYATNITAAATGIIIGGVARKK